jgi:predicted 3-demethylubiquinone-9 3-methyltransferase (glyoxalase superfamily)
MQKIIPHLWFDTNAEEAANFYTSVFRKGSVGEITRYTEAGYEVHKMKAGTVLTVEFSIEGFEMLALNGGPVFTFNPSISFMVHCPTKEEVDELWNKLSPGGQALMPLDAYPFSERYVWVKDKYGVSWQIMYMEGAERKIYPVLMYVGDVAGKAEEAIDHYISVFKNSKKGDIARYPAGLEPEKEGTIMYGDFYLEGQRFGAMDSANPGHEFNFNEAVSLLVLCKDQKEIDYFWEKLNRDPNEGQCGWLHDRWGVSWQIAPEGMGRMLNSRDKAASDRAMNAMLEMKKIDIALLKKAFDGK